MSQYAAGTISVTNGSTTVTGSAEVDWSTITNQHILFVAGYDTPYFITSVNSGTRTIVLAQAYGGPTNAATNYSIAIDFTPNHHLPLLGRGDLGIRALFNRAMALIDAFTGGTGGGGAVASVFGRTGTVTAQSGDYTAAQVTETASNKIMTSAERTKLSGIAAGATVAPSKATQEQAEAAMQPTADNTTYISPLRLGQAATANSWGTGGTGTGITESTPFGAGRAGETTRSLVLRIQDEVRPEDFGAVGNGSSDGSSGTDDHVAFNNAIAIAVSTGKLLRGDPGKNYRITVALTTISAKLRIQDCNFVATNLATMLAGISANMEVRVNGHAIQAGGVVQPTRAFVNYVGAGVVVSDDAANNRNIVTIGGGSAVVTPDKLQLGEISIDGSTAVSPLTITPSASQASIYHVYGSRSADLTLTVDRTGMLNGQPLEIYNETSGGHYLIVSADAGNRGIPVGTGLRLYNSSIQSRLKMISRTDVLGQALMSPQANNTLGANPFFWVGTTANLPVSRDSVTLYFTTD